MASQAAFRFGPFVLDPVAFRLRSSRGDAALSPKAIDLLLMLVREPARLFTRDEIFRALWPDVAVTDNALTQVVSEIRRALGDTPVSPRYLQTVARRGYRFVAPVFSVPLAVPTRGRAPAAPRAQPAVRRDVRSIRVLDFVNVSRDRALAWLSTGIAETLTNDLRSLRDLVVIDRSGEPEWEAVVSDLVVVGAFQRVDDQVRLTARVVDVRTREAIAHAKADGARHMVFALEDALARDLAGSLAAAFATAATRRARR